MYNRVGVFDMHLILLQNFQAFPWLLPLLTLWLVFELFTALGLALEHDKTELMHFDRSNDREDNPILDLTPVTGVRENYIKPKVHWRYLGFYFD